MQSRLRFSSQCLICRHAETQAGHTTVTLGRCQTVMAFRRVPAQVCANCGEAYVSEEITARLLEEASFSTSCRAGFHTRRNRVEPALPPDPSGGTSV